MLVTGYEVTGVTTDGRRFKRRYGADQLGWALGINLWRGSVWVKYADGTRTLMRRVWN